jgi:hypothetical protein
MFPVRTRAEFIVACTIAIAVIILACCGCGREKKVGTDKSPSDLADRLEQLRSLPYAVVTEDTVPSHESGLVLHKPEKAWKGYNIYCIQMVPRAFIIDMEGTVVHEWSYPETEGRWHHIIMLPDGDAVIINMFRHVLRLDWESNLLWRSKFCAHHDIVPLPDGTLYALGQQLQMHRDLFVRFPTIEHLAGDGTVISTWTTHDKLDEIKQHFDTRCFLDTVLDSLLAHESWLTVHEKIAERDEMVRSRGIRPEYDHFHMNTIGILPRTELGEADRRFREGNLLICFRNVNQIGILDRDTMEILWVWGEGILEWPHHPTMLENGNILVFDNGVRRKYSRVIELDPVSAQLLYP